MFCVALQEVNRTHHGLGTDDATDQQVVMTPFQHHFTQPDLVPGSQNKLAHKLVFNHCVLWVPPGILQVACRREVQ